MPKIGFKAPSKASIDATAASASFGFLSLQRIWQKLRRKP